MTNNKNLQTALKLQRMGRLGEAEKVYCKIIEDEPENHDALQLQGLVLSAKGQNKAAATHIEKAISLRPEIAAFHHNIAGIYRQSGRLQDAVSSFRQAIKLKPDYGEAYQGLSEMLKFETDDPLIDEIQEQLKNGNLSQSQLSYMNFAAGKVFADIGDHQKAFDHYTNANKFANRSFNSSKFELEVKDSLYVFSQEFVDQLNGLGSSSQQPVFIVGMPRSGSTLVEQILASHSKVYGAGELNDIKSIATDAANLVKGNISYPHYLPLLQDNHFGKIADAYLKRINSLAGGDYERIINKHPLNFKYLGLIVAMFPNAKIIHTRRNALDTCLSCYFQNFTLGQNYAFDLKSLASFYNNYRRMMSHWNTVLGDRIFHIDYEKLLSNQEGETARLLSYCELDFEESCLQFHKSERDVRTASFLQVRKPIYQSSIGRWRDYESNLKGLMIALGEEGDH